MYRMTIVYGMPEDPAHFRTYYYETHIPIARRMRGLTGWNLTWLDDDERHLLVAELYAADKATMDGILASPEGVAARDDLANFVTAGVEFLAGYEEEVALA